MWERACSRRRRVSPCICQLIHRIREQARSHTSRSQIWISGVFSWRKLPKRADRLHLHRPSAPVAALRHRRRRRQS
ncbi:hypothetical protein C0058_25725 [Pseudomonas sp. NC02]|nr:hypothetical protein C0058_25725 [Pseudomonas sp. NC02]